ncbi:hypothetical protein DPMN_192973 [Dreissena polymorpha]|uniref:Uncharacterized protein n=1 Tax=Dreissena polymorpha TaxID=45954 RepID=A0A9D3Y2H6_DREPO|nr:hypothetical protein DPMN_192973 [Dreissena polymorpha]
MFSVQNPRVRHRSSEHSQLPYWAPMDQRLSTNGSRGRVATTMYLERDSRNISTGFD